MREVVNQGPYFVWNHFQEEPMYQGQNLLKRKLSAGEAAVGMWITLEAPTITELAVDLGLDWIVIDAEHGHLDFQEIVGHLRVAHETRTTALVRIAEVEEGVIKRVLDLGADGLLIPQVNSPELAAQAVRFAKYPPWGIRGVGAERATRWGLKTREYTQTANDETLVIPLMENVAAGPAIDEILEVRGLDAIFFGPADFSASAGYVGQWEGPGVAAELLRIREKILARNVPCGILAGDADTMRLRYEQGFRMLSLGSDTGFLARGLQAMQQAFQSLKASAT